MERMDDWERWQLAGAEAFWSLEERLDHAEAHSEGTTEEHQEQGREEEVTVNAMTAAEFKSWLDGFMEGRGARLTQKDIKRIQAQAGSVTGGCSCYHPYTYHPWSPPWMWTNTPTIFTGTTSVGNDSTDCTPTTTTFTPGVYANDVSLIVSSTGNGLDTTSMCSG